MAYIFSLSKYRRDSIIRILTLCLLTASALIILLIIFLLSLVSFLLWIDFNMAISLVLYLPFLMNLARGMVTSYHQ